jgi:hypothetical protein
MLQRNFPDFLFGDGYVFGFWIIEIFFDAQQK